MPGHVVPADDNGHYVPEPGRSYVVPEDDAGHYVPDPGRAYQGVAVGASLVIIGSHPVIIGGGAEVVTVPIDDTGAYVPLDPER